MREPGFLFIGGGVCDAYQPAEATYRVTRGLLDLCHTKRVPVHLLTKSALVERDLDVLAAIGQETRAIVSFSIALVDERDRELIEPKAAPLAERWRLLEQARRLGLGAGVMAMPLLPGISDQPEAIDALVRQAKNVGADFVCAGGLTLRPGVQKDGYFTLLRNHYPDLLSGYQKLFESERASGIPDLRYVGRLDKRIRSALAKHRMPGRMPHRLFTGVVPLYTEISVLLEHRGFERGEPGDRTGPLTRTGFALAQWAHERLGHQRGKDGFRLIESELMFLARSGRLGEIPGLAPSALAALEVLLAEVIHAGGEPVQPPHRP
jgi:hypothetical protein